MLRYQKFWTTKRIQIGLTVFIGLVVLVSWAMPDATRISHSSLESERRAEDFTHEVFQMVEQDLEEVKSKPKTSNIQSSETEEAAVKDTSKSETNRVDSDLGSDPKDLSLKPDSSGSNELEAPDLSSQKSKKAKDQEESPTYGSASEYSLSELPLSEEEKEDILKEAVKTDIVKRHPESMPFFYPYRENEGKDQKKKKQDTTDDLKRTSYETREKQTVEPRRYRSSRIKTPTQQANDELDDKDSAKQKNEYEVPLPEDDIDIPEVFHQINHFLSLSFGSEFKEKSNLPMTRSSDIFSDPSLLSVLTQKARPLVLAPEWDTHWYRHLDKDFEQIFATRNKYLLSLGTGGSAVWKIKNGPLIDREGPDMYIQGNPFCYLKDPEQERKAEQDASIHFEELQPEDFDSEQFLNQFISARRFEYKDVACRLELAAVQVSETGKAGQWHAFSQCTRKDIRQCAGIRPNLWYAKHKDFR
ncbi:MAG: hypothetical protein KDD52_03915, partial [Bdellovibrionales bacterium]|nr:hypothetical protein [Bdellovibrionales bacterium]